MLPGGKGPRPRKGFLDHRVRLYGLGLLPQVHLHQPADRQDGSHLRQPPPRADRRSAPQAPHRAPLGPALPRRDHGPRAEVEQNALLAPRSRLFVRLDFRLHGIALNAFDLLGRFRSQIQHRYAAAVFSHLLPYLRFTCQEHLPLPYKGKTCLDNDATSPAIRANSSPRRRLTARKRSAFKKEFAYLGRRWYWTNDAQILEHTCSGGNG